MNWGNDFLQWLASEEGWRVLSGAIIPAAAIVVAGAIAALIARAWSRRVIALHQRDALTSAVGGFVLAGRKAAQWNRLSAVEQVQLEHLIAETETRIRLLPINGAGMAANWASRQLESMKRDSAGFQFQAQQTMAEYRDRLIGWSERPRTAKRLFGADLERWSYDDATQSASATPQEHSVTDDDPPQTWVPSPSASGRSPLTPDPPTAVATATGSMPLIITTPIPASAVRQRVVPASGA